MTSSLYLSVAKRHLLGGLTALLILSSCSHSSGNVQQAGSGHSVSQAPAGMEQLSMFSGATGAAYDWQQLLAAMDSADVIIIGESHTDGRGHAIQAKIISAAGQRWSGLTVSLEEFDRSQQPVLDAYERGELSGAEVKATRSFVMPTVRDNWLEWNLPKLEAARQAGAPLLASNAPLKYSRMVRNKGCENLSDLSADELALFECPAVAEDPAYKARFVTKLTRAIKNNKSVSLKPLQTEQTDKMFQAQRVWDATMAASIVQARADGADKVLHVVGAFHVDFNGGLVQELRYRDPDSRMLVICMAPRTSKQLLSADRGRADIVIYRL
jgi:uncharacterized iron-regulated protein